MYKRQRLFTSIELTTIKVPGPLHIWVVYKDQGDYSMLPGRWKKTYSQKGQIEKNLLLTGELQYKIMAVKRNFWFNERPPSNKVSLIEYTVNYLFE